MKKLFLIISILILSACSETKVVESCRYSIIVSSFLPEADQTICQTVYDSIDSAKFNRTIVEQREFDIFSIHIRFMLNDGVEETYFIGKDGTITYEMNGMIYKIKIDKEMVNLLINNIESQKS